MSYYAGLDVSSKYTSIAIVDHHGKIIFETECETDPEVISKTLQSRNLSLEKIGIESGNMTFWLMDGLREAGLKACCIDSRQMAALLKLNINKTDRNDARKIADAMRCNLYKEVHHKTKEAIEIGVLMGSRRSLVSIRTQLKNTIRGLLKVYGIRFGTVSLGQFSDKVRQSLKFHTHIVQVA